MYHARSSTFCSFYFVIICYHILRFLSVLSVLLQNSDICISVIYFFQVYEAVLSWVKYDFKKRSQHFGHIMEYVRLPLVTQEYLVKV